MRVYYHPRVGDYAWYPSFEWDYALAGAGVGGVVVGAGSYALRKANGGSLLWSLAGALVGGGVAGALIPKRILSWFNPPPFNAPIVYPRQIPKVVVPSFIGESGQVLNLLMHHGAGNIVRDYSGFNNHGRIYDAVWRDGSYGWALYFNGTSAYVEVPDSASLRLTGDMTVELWFNIFDYAQRSPLVAKWTGEYFLFIYEGSGEISFYRFGSDMNYYNLVRHGEVGTHKWNYVAAVSSGTKLYLYFNDEPRIEADWYGEAKSTTQPVQIAHRPDVAVGEQHFHGLIAFGRIYSRPLSAKEIRYHFESTRAIFGV